MSRTLSLEQLVNQIFTDPLHPLVVPFTDWISGSKRFRHFAETYRTKIRAKIRNAADAEGLNDLVFELEIARWLLQESRLSIAYEPHNLRKMRGPDFLVTFTTAFAFGVEVTRMRSSASILDSYTPDERPHNRLLNIICGKLGQTLPGMINLLVIGTDEPTLDQVDLNALLAELKKRAQTKDAQVFSRSSVDNSADFFRAYQRLSAILVRSTQSQLASSRSILWVNKEARHPLPGNLQTILKR